MKAKKGRKWTEEQKQAAKDRWTPEMRGEARYRALVYHHRDLLIRLMETPERIQVLKKLVTPLESREKRSLFGSMNAEI